MENGFPYSKPSVSHKLQVERGPAHDPTTGGTMRKGLECLASVVALVVYSMLIGGAVEAFIAPATISVYCCSVKGACTSARPVSRAHAADHDGDDQRVFWDVVVKVGGGHHWRRYSPLFGANNTVSKTSKRRNTHFKIVVSKSSSLRRRFASSRGDRRP